MNRIPLKNDHLLNLKNKSGMIFQYKIRGMLKEGMKGSSCLCYIAEKMQPSSVCKIIILKEFYPDDVPSQISRMEDGTLIMHREKDKYLSRRWTEFERGTWYLNKFANLISTRPFICADSDIEILIGNGTIYCENQFYNGSSSWKEFRDSKYSKMDDMIQTAIGTIRFLRQLHLEKTAYVDLKPEDILIPVAENREMDFQNPLFYDFNSALAINQKYKPWEITCTDEYKAAGFAVKPGEGINKELEVNLDTENCTYAKVFEYQIEKKVQTISSEVQDKMFHFIDELKGKGERALTEIETEKELLKIRDQIRDDECDREYRNLPNRIKNFNLFRWIILIITISSYILMGFIMSYMCLHSKMIQEVIEKNERITITGIVIFLFIITLGINGLKLLNSLIGGRIANTAVSVKYYHTDIRTGEYNTFRYWTRKKTTFQDTSENNIKRQQSRRILWVLLAVGIMGSFGVSIYCESFPVFLAIGFIILIVFMLADCIPTHKEYFKNYAKLRNLPFSGEIDGRKGMALFYCNEYLNANHSFDLKNDYYAHNNRNVFLMRKRVMESCYSHKSSLSVGVFEKIRALYDYEHRILLATKWKEKDSNLKFSPLQIRHIYKMAFDRLRNQQLIINLVVLVVTLFAVFLDFMTYTGKLVTYFKIPDQAYFWITVLTIIGVCATSVFQVLHSVQYEKLVAEMSYKLRYIIDEALNNELAKDIAANFIIPIDIARGTYQYCGYITTEMNSRKRRKLMNEEHDYNRPLFHHRELANRQRLFMIVWLGFGILFSIICWHMGVYWMFFVLFPVAVIVNLLFRKYFLPVFEKKQLIADIEALLDEKGLL